MSGEKDPSFRWITNEIPDEPKLLEAMGRVAIRHSQLNSMLTYVLKTLAMHQVSQKQIFEDHADWLVHS